VELDTVVYAFQIRQLAARHQSGEDLRQIKNLVDDVIRSMEVNLKYHYHYHYHYHYQNRLHLKMWSELFKNLNTFTNKCSDPDWMTVIAYARRQVSRKKGAAKARLK